MRLYYYFNPKKQGDAENEYGVLEDILRNRQIKISRVTLVNDPFDFQVSFSPETNQAYIQGFRKKFAEIEKEMGMVCFSESVDNVLMWSHYADKHKGFALELEVDVGDKRLVQVNYSSIAPEIFKIRNGNNGYTFKNVHNVLRTKAIDWAYEKEWRMIISYSDDQVVQEGVDEGGKAMLYLKLNTDTIKAIHVGLRSELTPCALRTQLDKYNLDHVEIYAMKQSLTGYSLSSEACDMRKEQIKVALMARASSLEKIHP